MLHMFLDGKYWFRRKRYGLGAFPSTWQGWTLTLAFIGFMLGMALYQDGKGGEPDTLWWAIVIGATLLFVLIAWRKTEGGWGWRWGGD